MGGGFTRGSAKASNKAASKRTPPIELLADAAQAIGIMLIPFLRNPVRASPNLVAVHRFRPTECWLKSVPASNHAVDAFSSISAPQGPVRKVPLARIEAETLVYKSCVHIRSTRTRTEHHLAPVTVDCPFI